MENTVTISLELYNELRDFKENIQNGKVGIMYIDWNDNRTFLYPDKNELNIALHNEIKELKNKIDEFKNENKSIKEIKKMNIIQFLKWKRLK